MACTDMTIRLEVDGLATGSSASTKSRSLQLLLVLHTLLGAAVLQRKTSAAAQVEDAARCDRRLDSGVHTCHDRATHVELVSSAAGPSRRRLHSRNG